MHLYSCRLLCDIRYILFDEIAICFNYVFYFRSFFIFLSFHAVIRFVTHSPTNFIFFTMFPFHFTHLFLSSSLCQRFTFGTCVNKISSILLLLLLLFFFGFSSRKCEISSFLYKCCLFVGSLEIFPRMK